MTGETEEGRDPAGLVVEVAMMNQTKSIATFFGDLVTLGPQRFGRGSIARIMSLDPVVDRRKTNPVLP